MLNKFIVYPSVLIVIFLSGCSLLEPRDDNFVKIIYEKSAQYHQPDRNPVIVIPGILGSKLVDQKTGTRVWGAFNRTSADPDTLQGIRLLSLPIEEDKRTCPISGVCSLKHQKDTIKSDGVLDKVNISLLGVPLIIRAYANILATLGAGGYRDEELGLNGLDYGSNHYSCFQFDYDWRRDNVENAKRLHEFIQKKKIMVQKQYEKEFGLKNYDVKFDIVAHSMGGLLTRYYLRYGDKDLDDIDLNNIPWTGAHDVEKVVLVGTPNAGSLDAYTQLTEGYDVGKPFLPFYPAALLGTYPSVYQLLPRPRHRSIVWKNTAGENTNIDLYDPLVWQQNNWGLASKSPKNTRVIKNILPNIATQEERQTITFQQQGKMLKRAQKFHQALDTPSNPPQTLMLYLVAGDSVSTVAKLQLDRTTGKVIHKETAPGDGTVLRSSALLDERLTGQWTPQLKTPIQWKSVIFLPSDHLGLTKDKLFENNVLFWLLEERRDRKKRPSSKYSETMKM